MTLTAAIISKSEDIPSQTLESLAFADEIVIVVDSESDRKPVLKGKIKYYFHPLNADFAAQRNYAIAKSTSFWILFVDTDEYVSSELAQEISERIKSTKLKGFYLPRRDVVFHDVLRHGETGEIKILRLAQKNAGKFTRSVHERWNISGPMGDLLSPLYHIKDHFVSGFLSRIGKYGPADAQSLNAENKPFSFFRLLVFPKAKFIQNYYLRLGFLDGKPGLFLAYLMAIQSLSVRIFQWTKRS